MSHLCVSYCTHIQSACVQVEQLQERLQKRDAEAAAGQEAQQRLQASCQAASSDRDRLQEANVSLQPSSFMPWKA